MKKLVLNIVFVLYLALSITITSCLLEYNEFDVPDFKNEVLISLKKDLNGFKKGSILFIPKTKNIEKGMKVYYFNNIEKLSTDEITEIYDDTVMLNNDIIDKDSIMGLTKGTKSVGYLGYIFSILTSKVGYLLIIIFPVLFLFLFEIYLFVNYIKAIRNKKGDKNEKKSGQTL